MCYDGFESYNCRVKTKLLKNTCYIAFVAVTVVLGNDNINVVTLFSSKACTYIGYILFRTVYYLSALLVL